jgi:hypothetical protein
MKEETQQSHENNDKHGRGVFTSGRKWTVEHKIASKHLTNRRKRDGGLEKMTCKPMTQDENEKNYKKESTPVLGKKPYGKYQINIHLTHQM